MSAATSGFVTGKYIPQPEEVVGVAVKLQRDLAVGAHWIELIQGGRCVAAAIRGVQGPRQRHVTDDLRVHRVLALVLPCI